MCPAEMSTRISSLRFVVGTVVVALPALQWRQVTLAAFDSAAIVGHSALFEHSILLPKLPSL